MRPFIRPSPLSIKLDLGIFIVCKHNLKCMYVSNVLPCIIKYGQTVPYSKWKKEQFHTASGKKNSSIQQVEKRTIPYSKWKKNSSIQQVEKEQFHTASGNSYIDINCVMANTFIINCQVAIIKLVNRRPR